MLRGPVPVTALDTDLAAAFWRRRFGPRERALLLAIAYKAADPVDQEALSFHAGGVPPLKLAGR